MLASVESSFLSVCRFSSVHILVLIAALPSGVVVFTDALDPRVVTLNPKLWEKIRVTL
jgi:hypothetical protein